MDNNLIESIMSNIKYPKRMLAGLDNINIDDMREYLSGDKLYALGIRLTNVCNYSCVYCGTEERRGVDNKDVLNIDEYIDIVHQAAECGASTIILGGNGEPTMTKGLPELLKEIAKFNMTPVIFSNMSLIGNDELCEKIHGIDGKELLNIMDETGTTIIISCESINEERYNFIVGKENAYKYFSIAMDRVKETGLVKEQYYKNIPLCRLAFSTVVMPVDYEDRFDMIKFAHSLNALIILKVPSLHGAAEKNIQLMFDIETANKIKVELAELSDKQATLQILNLACIAWTLGISINNEGDFMTCMTDETNPYGEGVNVRNTKIKDLLGKRKELLKLKNTVCPVKDQYYI